MLILVYIPLSLLCSCSDLNKVSKPEQDEIQVLNSSLDDTFTCDFGRGAKSNWTISPTDYCIFPKCSRW